jgi:quercetin dioxygenase-like cupin family protein
MTRTPAFVSALVALSACHGSSTSPGEAPAPTSDAASAASPASPASPVSASFLALPQTIAFAKCHELFLAPVQGSASVEGEALAVGDVVAMVGGSLSKLDVPGSGLLFVASVQVPCDAPAGKHVVRATQAPELTFMGGAMHAHLDVDDRAVSPAAYLGRLAGTAAVPEHTHPGAWEVLCAVEAAGTFTLAGKDQRLAPRTCVSVPPDVKHAWKPDPGSNLVAVQIYTPPGPEQRFKKLADDYAAAKAEAGAAK